MEGNIRPGRGRYVYGRIGTGGHCKRGKRIKKLGKKKTSNITKITNLLNKIEFKLYMRGKEGTTFQINVKMDERGGKRGGWERDRNEELVNEEKRIRF